MQRKISRRLIMLSVLTLIVGITVAYYNTASFGYDNANLFSLDYDSVNIFDIEIKYDTIKNVIRILKEFVITQFVVI